MKLQIFFWSGVEFVKNKPNNEVNLTRYGDNRHLKNEEISLEGMCEITGWGWGMEERVLTTLAFECLSVLFLSTPYSSPSIYELHWETMKYNSS